MCAFFVRFIASIRIALRYLSEKSLMLPRDTCRHLLIERLCKVAHILSVSIALSLHTSCIADCDYQKMQSIYDACFVRFVAFGVLFNSHRWRHLLNANIIV